MKQSKGRGEAHFQSEEMYNEKGHFKTNQSEMTPESVANDCYGIFEMKEDAFDEAYGMSGKRGTEHMHKQIKQQFMHYDWQ